MMQVKIAGSGEVKTLSLIDPVSGVDFVQDFVGNNGGFNKGGFTYNGDEYECTKDAFDWWEKVIDDQRKLVDRIQDLKEEHGSESVCEVLESISSHDLEDDAAITNAALDEAFAAAEEEVEAEMRYWMIHGGNGGEQLGCWKAESKEDALEMLAKGAGYASKKEADKVLQESGGHVYPEKVEEITEDEYNAVEALLAAGYSDQGDALRDYREAVEAGDTWMLDTIVYGSLDEWKGLTRTEFNQALSNANHDPFPAFETPVETDAAYDSAWERLQKELAAESADIAYQEHNNREIREGLEAHGRDEFDQSNEED